MGNLRPGAKIIYESPDGGGTVYGRYKGETDRWMVGQSTNAKSLRDKLQEDELWKKIRQEAESNSLLQEALDRAIMIYHLSRKDDAK